MAAVAADLCRQSYYRWAAIPSAEVLHRYHDIRPDRRHDPALRSSHLVIFLVILVLTGKSKIRQGHLANLSLVISILALLGANNYGFCSLCREWTKIVGYGSFISNGFGAALSAMLNNTSVYGQGEKPSHYCRGIGHAGKRYCLRAPCQLGYLAYLSSICALFLSSWH